MIRLAVDVPMSTACNDTWVLRNKYGWGVSASPDADGGAVLEVDRAVPDTALYARTVVDLELASSTVVKLTGSLDCSAKDRCRLSATAFADGDLLAQLGTTHAKLKSGCPSELRLEVPCGGRVRLVLQFNFPAEAFVARRFALSVTTEARDSEFVPQAFGITSCGPWTRASARLRAWRLAAELGRAGHEVSINEPNQARVQVFQKVRPFKALAKLADPTGRILVFDVDDNYFEDDRGDRNEFIAFLNQVDLVTVGSEHLRALVERFHPNVVLLDNPADIQPHSAAGPARPWRGRVGWFGAPENASQLALVDHEGEITTVTRGGDVEYDQGTIDRTLVDFDLLVFPLAVDAWSAAKNANRMVKAAALGVPCLASETPEHVRAAALMGLPERYLVPPGESWGSRIEAIARDYDEVLADFASVRARTLDAYAPERIARQFFDAVSATPKRGSGGRAGLVDARLSKVDLFVMGSRHGPATLAAFARASEVDLGSFARTVVFDHRLDANAAFALESEMDVVAEPDPLVRYERFDEQVRASGAEYILYVEDGTPLLRPVLQGIELGHDVLAFDTTGFGEPHGRLVRHPLEAWRLLVERVGPSMLLIRRDWLIGSGLLASEMLSWFPLAVWLEALLSPDATTASTSFPVAVHTAAAVPANVSDEFARYRLSLDPGAKHDLPDTTKQWLRLSHDIVHSMLERHPAASATIAARLTREAMTQALRKRAA